MERRNCDLFTCGRSQSYKAKCAISCKITISYRFSVNSVETKALLGRTSFWTIWTRKTADFENCRGKNTGVSSVTFCGWKYCWAEMRMTQSHSCRGVQGCSALSSSSHARSELQLGWDIWRTRKLLRRAYFRTSSSGRTSRNEFLFYLLDGATCMQSIQAWNEHDVKRNHDGAGTCWAKESRTKIMDSVWLRVRR